MDKTIQIARDFSRFPAGRHRSDGPYSGERFREDFLIPALKQGRVTLVLDEVAGLPSSFLEEAIGGLIRAGLSLSDIEKNLQIVAWTLRMASYPEQARRYLHEEQARRPQSAA